MGAKKEIGQRCAFLRQQASRLRWPQAFRRDCGRPGGQLSRGAAWQHSACLRNPTSNRRQPMADPRQLLAAIVRAFARKRLRDYCSCGVAAVGPGGVVAHRAGCEAAPGNDAAPPRGPAGRRLFRSRHHPSSLLSRRDRRQSLLCEQFAVSAVPFCPLCSCDLRLFGIVVLAGGIVAAAAFVVVFVSVWCFFAATASIVIAVHFAQRARQPIESPLSA